MNKDEILQDINKLDAAQILYNLGTNRADDDYSSKGCRIAFSGKVRELRELLQAEYLEAIK